MSLAKTINIADRLVKKAAECHAQGKMDDCLEILLELREHMDNPIEAGGPGEDDTSENCTLCGKPKT